VIFGALTKDLDLPDCVLGSMVMSAPTYSTMEIQIRKLSTLFLRAMAVSFSDSKAPMVRRRSLMYDSNFFWS
jgi:hypothetical protein